MTKDEEGKVYIGLGHALMAMTRIAEFSDEWAIRLPEAPESWRRSLATRISQMRVTLDTLEGNLSMDTPAPPAGAED